MSASWKDKVDPRVVFNVQRYRSGRIHQAEARCGGRWQRGGRSVPIIDVLENILDQACQETYCVSRFDGNEQDALEFLHRQLEGLSEDLWKVPVLTLAGHLANVKHLEAALQLHNNLHSIDAAYKDLILELVRVLKDQYELVLTTCRTPEYQTHLRAELLEHSNFHQGVLTSCDLGDIHDQGMLVRTPKPTWASVSDGLTLMMVGHHGPLQQVITEPMGVLMWVLVYQDGNSFNMNAKKVRRKLIKAPSDLTPELEETIAGLYEPDGEGSMGDLREVLTAAREVLK